MSHDPQRAGPAPIIAELLGLLRCPTCSATLQRAPEGELSCAGGHAISADQGYLDLSAESADLTAERTFESFGYEWNAFPALRAEDRTFWERYFADVDLSELHGRIGLDAGCGKGRYSYYTAQMLRGLIALDGSPAVAAAAGNLASSPNTIVVKADLLDPPCAASQFGFISCLGVLHHLTDPPEGFRSLVRLLAPDGLLLVYLYSRPASPGLRAAALSAAAALRRLTVRLPHRILRIACLPLSALLYAVIVVPGSLGTLMRSKRLQSLPLRAYRGQPVRSLWLDTFDRLSAPVEHRFSWPEVQPWFAAAGLQVEAVREDYGLTVLARRQIAEMTE